jgi:hypothetical protein
VGESGKPQGGETIPDEEFLLSVDHDGSRPTTQRIRPIYKQQGNEKTEQSRRQIANKEIER